MHPIRVSVPFLATVLLATSGCTGITKPSNFYLLDAGGSGLPPESAGGIALGIGPVKLPGYLDRPQIVTRESPHQLQVAEFSRWAEPLADSVSRTLAQELSSLLGTERISLYPWSRDLPEQVQVTLDVLRFDARDGEGVVLDALWKLLRDDGRELLASRRTRIIEPVPVTGDYEALVAAQSRAVTGLSREIAAAISGL